MRESRGIKFASELVFHSKITFTLLEVVSVFLSGANHATCFTKSRISGILCGITNER